MSIWFHDPSEEVRSKLGGGMERTLGIEITEIGSDFIRGTMPVDDRTKQPYGLLHGGANVVLAETLGSIGASLTVDPQKFFSVGVEVNANHLRSATKEHVTGTARPHHIGRTMQVWGIEIVDSDGKLTAICRLTVAIREINESSRVKK
jgi:1,4-dihydroxy-2-naphthoyl-CoA hydrolase